METLPLWDMAPDNGLVSSGSGYVLAAPGRAYLAYLPTGGSIGLDLSATLETFDAGWLDPSDGSTQSAGSVSGGSVASFTATGC